MDHKIARAHLAAQVLRQRPRTTTLALFYDISVGIGVEICDMNSAAAYDVNLQLNEYSRGLVRIEKDAGSYGASSIGRDLQQALDSAKWNLWHGKVEGR